MRAKQRRPRRVAVSARVAAPPDTEIPAHALLKALLWGRLLRYGAFLAVERLVRSAARKALGLSRRRFGDDALGYFTQRLLAAKAPTAWKSGMPTTSIPGRRSVGRQYESFAIASTNPRVNSSKLSG